MAIASKNRGKSKGARVITYVITDDLEIYLVAIYDKGDLNSMSKQEIIEILDELELRKK